MRSAPVIIIGMHRSGTSLVARQLIAAGVFLGSRLDVNAEATLFQGLNDWLLDQTAAAWDQPAPFLRLMEYPNLLDLEQDYLAGILASPRALTYTGLRRYRHFVSANGLDEPWGWKDPRNTFTLPIWLRLYPDAHVVHVLRHGVDAAASLLTRTQSRATTIQSRYAQRRRTYWIRPKSGGFVPSLRSSSLADAFGLWKEYVAQARQDLESVGSRGIEIRYESFLADPHAEMGKLTSFLDISGARAASSLGQSVAGQRSLAFRRDPSLVEFAGSVAQDLGRYGYNP